MVRRVGGLLFGTKPLGRGGLLAHERQVRLPGRTRGGIVVARRRGVASATHIEHQARDGAKVVGQQGAMPKVHAQRALAQRQVVVPASQLHV